MNKKRRKDLIEEIIYDCEAIDYRNFVVGCIRRTLNLWSDAEIYSWFNGKKDAELRLGIKK